MSRPKIAHRRPTLALAIDWIAHEDNAGASDTAHDIAGYISTALVADLFGAGRHVLAREIVKARQAAGLEVGQMSAEIRAEFNDELELETI